MKAIRKVVIENFQIHHKRTIDFVDGINVIVGESDRGKSAIIRAIYWVLRNEPQGLGFISAGKKQAKVTVEFSDGLKITRVRSSTVNQYQITEDGETTKLDNFGKGVPPIIAEKIGFNPVDIGGEELDLNFAKQLAAPFLLETASPAGRMKIINQLSGVGPMSQIIGGMNKDITNAGREVTKVEALKTSHQEQLEDLGDKTSKLNQFISGTEPLVTSLEDALETLELLNSFGETSSILANLAERLANLGVHLEELDGAILGAESNISKLRQLAELKSELARAEESLSACSHLEDLRVGAEYPVDEIEEGIERYKWLRNLASELRKVEAEGQNISEEETTLRDKMRVQEERIKEFIEEQGACPVCEKPFDESDIERMAS